VEWATDTAVISGPLSPAARQWVDSRTAARAVEGSAASVVDQPSGLSHGEVHEILNDPLTGTDFHLMSDLFHPTESVYLDPLFGEFRGQRAIRSWITDVMAKVGNLAFEPVGPVLFDGDTSVQEWKQMAVLPDGGRVMMLRGTSVRRFSDGWIVYAADYFDTAPLADPEIQAASLAAGSTITLEDIMRHRTA